MLQRCISQLPERFSHQLIVLIFQKDQGKTGTLFLQLHISVIEFQVLSSRHVTMNHRKTWSSQFVTVEFQCLQVNPEWEEKRNHSVMKSDKIYSILKSHRRIEEY